MQFESELEVRRQLARHLSDAISLDEFEDWLVPRSWNFHKEASPSLQALVSEIELLLAEFSNGHRSEEELRRALLPLVTNYESDYRIDTGSPTVQTSSGSNVSESLLKYRPQDVDISLSPVHA